MMRDACCVTLSHPVFSLPKLRFTSYNYITLTHAVQDELFQIEDSSMIRKRIIFSLFIVTPLGFIFKLYHGPGHWWFNNYGAGLLYEIFWCLIIFFFTPNRRTAMTIVLWVFGITCSLEILQLWHPWFLELIRSTFLGKALIGTSFSWWDFPHYAVGCVFGWILMRLSSKDNRH